MTRRLHIHSLFYIFEEIYQTKKDSQISKKSFQSVIKNVCKGWQVLQSETEFIIKCANYNKVWQLLQVKRKSSNILETDTFKSSVTETFKIKHQLSWDNKCLIFLSTCEVLRLTTGSVDHGDAVNNMFAKPWTYLYTVYKSRLPTNSCIYGIDTNQEITSF